MNKVIGGTPKSGQSLCLTCRNAIVVKGHNLENLVQCTELYGDYVVPFSVSECSRYDDKSTPALHDMKQIAWAIETKPKNKAGFASGTAAKGEDGTLDIVITPPKKKADQEGSPLDE